MAALEEIIALTIADANVRKALRQCEQACQCLRNLKNIKLDSNPDSDIAVLASRALDAVENEGVHRLWSNVNFQVPKWQDIQRILAQEIASDKGLPSEPAKTSKSRWVILPPSEKR